MLGTNTKVRHSVFCNVIPRIAHIVLAVRNEDETASCVKSRNEEENSVDGVDRVGEDGALLLIDVVGRSEDFCCGANVAMGEWEK